MYPFGSVGPRSYPGPYVYVLGGRHGNRQRCRRLALRATVIGSETAPDDYVVHWNGLSIGRILKQPGVPDGRSNWFWAWRSEAGLSRQVTAVTAVTLRNASGGSKRHGPAFAQGCQKRISNCAQGRGALRSGRPDSGLIQLDPRGAVFVYPLRGVFGTNVKTHYPLRLAVWPHRFDDITRSCFQRFDIESRTISEHRKILYT